MKPFQLIFTQAGQYKSVHRRQHAAGGGCHCARRDDGCDDVRCGECAYYIYEYRQQLSLRYYEDKQVG